MVGRPVYIDALKLFRLFSPANSFSSEKRQCDLIERNISDLCERYLGVCVESYEREHRVGITDLVRLGVVRPRVDFMVRTKCGKKVAIECKNGKRLPDNTQGIAQLLIYKELGDFDELVLISSHYSPHIQAIIDRYSLPIKVLWMNKTDIAYVTR